MYTPKPFKNDNLAELIALIRANPLATVVQVTASGMVANHIPMHLSVNEHQITLLAHVARANPLWQDAQANDDVLLVFQDTHCPIPANWYASKAENHKVVPTWNYAAVHITGKIIVHDDAAWVREQMNQLVATHEKPYEQQPAWQINDAPTDYIEANLRAVMGIEIIVNDIQGKFKVSQNQPEINRASVLNALYAQNTDRHTRMADLIQSHTPKSEPT